MRLFKYCLILIGLISAPVFAQTDRAQPVVLANETILRVSGEGIVRVEPELLEVSIGVTTTAETAKEALAANNGRSLRLVETIRATGIAPNDIRTTDLEVQPEYAEDEDTDRIIGWRAVNTLTVRTNRLADAGEMIRLMFEAGGNTLGGPDFDLTEPTKRKASRAAEAKALEEAREQAEAAAAALGMRVSRVLLVSDSNVRFDGGSGYIVVTGSRIRIPSVPIELGEIEVTAKYSVEYALIPN